MGFQTTGTASEFFAVDAKKVTVLPEKMSYDEGAMIEPLAVAVHAVKRAGDVKGMKIAVWDRYLEHLSILITNLRMAFDCDIMLGGYIGGDF